jgi:Ca2+-binding EF-hand superfamily protein
MPFLEVEEDGVVKFKSNLKRSEYDWYDEEALSYYSEDDSGISGKREPSKPSIKPGNTLEPIEHNDSPKDGIKHGQDSLDSIKEEDHQEPPILVIDHGEASKADSQVDRFGRRKSHIEIMADKIVLISSMDELIKIMRESKISWMDFFYQIDSSHAEKVSSYEVYIHLFRDMKMSKKLATTIVRGIDFNMDGFATLEEWMKYEVKLPADIQQNGVYKWADFKAKLFQTLKDNNMKWSSIFDQSRQFNGLSYVPTKFILETMVQTLHMPRVNVKELLQKIDIDQDGIITEKEWNSYFREADVTDQAVRQLIFASEEKVTAGAVKAANRFAEDGFLEAANLASLGIVDEINLIDQLPVVPVSSDSAIGVSMPQGDYTLWIENDLATLDALMLPLFNDPTKIQKLDQIRKNTLERVPTNMIDGSPMRLNTSPSAKEGVIAPIEYNQKLVATASSGNERPIKPVKAESQLIENQGSAKDVKGSFGFDSNIKKDFISPIKEEPEKDQKGLQDMDKFSEGISAGGNHGNFEGSFDLEGSEGKSAGLERSFSQLSIDSNSISHLTPENQQKTISITVNASPMMSKEFASEILETLTLLKLTIEEVSVTQLVSMITRQCKAVPKKVLAEIIRTADSNKSGMVKKSELEKLVEVLSQQVQRRDIDPLSREAKKLDVDIRDEMYHHPFDHSTACLTSNDQEKFHFLAENLLKEIETLLKTESEIDQTEKLTKVIGRWFKDLSDSWLIKSETNLSMPKDPLEVNSHKKDERLTFAPIHKKRPFRGLKATLNDTSRSTNLISSANIQQSIIPDTKTSSEGTKKLILATVCEHFSINLDQIVGQTSQRDTVKQVVAILTNCNLHLAHEVS